MLAVRLAGVAAMLLATNAIAQPSLAEVCQDVDMPTLAEYEGDPTAYADNFCALATYAPHRAARQFDSMVSLVRAHNNPNRHYWDRRIEPTAEHLQLLRPWMAEQDFLLQRLNLDSCWPPYDGTRSAHAVVVCTVFYARYSSFSLTIGQGIGVRPWYRERESDDYRPRYVVRFYAHGPFGRIGTTDRYALLHSGGGTVSFYAPVRYFDLITQDNPNEGTRGREPLEEPTGENVAATVHAALDCLGVNNDLLGALGSDGVGEREVFVCNKIDGSWVPFP